jgi:hypothetical protein
VLQTTFTIQKVKHHFALTIFKDSLTSAVSPDCDIKIYIVFLFGRNVSYKNSLDTFTSVFIPDKLSNQFLPTIQAK